MRREKGNKGVVYVAIFIAFIMVTSVLGFIFGSDDETMSYGKHVFYKKNLKWVIRTDSGELGFDYFPAEIEHISLDENAKTAIINSKMVYVTYEPNQTNAGELGFAQFDISQKLFLLDVYAGSGMTAENEYDIPIVTCKNATQFVPVILLKQGGENEIRMEGGCIILDGNPLMLKDRLLYGIFGIIENE